MPGEESLLQLLDDVVVGMLATLHQLEEVPPQKACAVTLVAGPFFSIHGRIALAKLKLVSGVDPFERLCDQRGGLPEGEIVDVDEALDLISVDFDVFDRSPGRQADDVPVWIGLSRLMHKPCCKFLQTHGLLRKHVFFT